jgi:pimeloyl-ACP methyl ester carboxylesterase
VFRIWPQLLAAAILLLAWMRFSAIEPSRESGTLPIDPPTPYIHYFYPSTGAEPPERVLVVHGLDVSKEVMYLVSTALADGGFDVYAIDLPGHGDSYLGFHTELAEKAIRNAKVFLGERVVVVGHSLGAGLLLDLAATEQFSTIVLLSPPPVAISEIHAERILIATGEMDIPRIRDFVPIAKDIADPNVESWMLPWAAHSSPILNPVYVRRVVEWLGGNGGKVRSVSRILWFAAMFVAAVALGTTLLHRRALQAMKTSVPTDLACYTGASTLALGVLKFVNPVSWIHIFAADYLVGFVLITGCGLLLMRLTPVGAHDYIPSPNVRNIVKGMLCAVFVLAVVGGIVSSRVLHMALSDGRWWRFPLIALAGLPLFISDELTLRRIGPRWKSDVLGLLTRALFLAFLLSGVLTFNRQHAFLVLIAPIIILFWVGLWFATGLVHRHTQDPFAAAVFAALVQGWAFAAWFVTI